MTSEKWLEREKKTKEYVDSFIPGALELLNRCTKNIEWKIESRVELLDVKYIVTAKTQVCGKEITVVRQSMYGEFWVEGSLPFCITAAAESIVYALGKVCFQADSYGELGAESIRLLKISKLSQPKSSLTAFTIVEDKEISTHFYEALDMCCKEQ